MKQKLPAVTLPDTSVGVVVVKTVRDLIQQGGLGIARSLGRLGVPVYWAYGDPKSPAARSRYVRESFTWALDGRTEEKAVEELLEIGAKIGGRPLLIPIDDGGTVFVDAHAAALREAYRFPERPEGLARRLSNKKEMHALCKQLDIPVPETTYPQSRADVLRFLESAVFPVVLKPAAGWAAPSAMPSHGIVIARDEQELLGAYDAMENAEQPNLMLQEYIPGPPDSVWMFNGYFDERSDCLVGFTGRKLRQHPAYTGSTTLGVCAPNEEVDVATRRLMKAVEYRGILDLGFRYDARDGRYKLLDVNPRIGSTFRLFVGRNGIDVVRALYLDLTGHPVPAEPAREGRKWIVENLDLVSSARYYRDGALTLRDWLRSFRGVEERAWFARDDVRPFLGMARQFALKALGRAARLGRRRAAAEDIADQQHRVNAYFASESSYWKRVYEENGVQAEIYQHRRSLVLDWIAQLGLPRGARILEVGCGAGLTAVELAQHGYLVDAIDSSDAMVELTRAHAAEAGVSERLRARTGDVHALAYEAASFDVVLAIGVLPWLHTPQAAIAELARVAKPGGYVLLTSDNRLRLVHLLDPRFNPALAPARRFVKASLRLLGYRPAANGPRSYLHAPRTVDRLVAAAGLNKARSTTLGFAPFTFLGKPALPRRLDSKVNGVLQALADRRVPVVRAAGSHYLVLAERSAER